MTHCHSVCVLQHVYPRKAAPAGGGGFCYGVDGVHLGERGARNHSGLRAHGRLLGYQ